jgi:hypothetical protein
MQWMLFCDVNKVNDIWSVVARYTANNELGTCAKVAPFPESGDDTKPRLICIYTKDFTDVKDVSRVVHTLKNLGLIDVRGRGIYYKVGEQFGNSLILGHILTDEDIYTYLGLSRDNQYGIKASMYSSGDFLKAGPEKAKDLKLKGNVHSEKHLEEDDWEL